jgi:hypothetical protein
VASIRQHQCLLLEDIYFTCMCSTQHGCCRFRTYECSNARHGRCQVHQARHKIGGNASYRSLKRNSDFDSVFFSYIMFITFGCFSLLQTHFNSLLTHYVNLSLSLIMYNLSLSAFFSVFLLFSPSFYCPFLCIFSFYMSFLELHSSAESFCLFQYIHFFCPFPFFISLEVWARLLFERK